MRRKIQELLSQERDLFIKTHPESGRAHSRSYTRLPFGVGSSFQFFEPHPVTITHADGPYAGGVDGERYLDFNMGFGALLVGHRHPAVVEAVTKQLEIGTLYVAPSALSYDVADRLSEHFSHPLWRFTNSGTEAVMSAVRVARAFSGRELLIKVRGGYHGHSDVTMVSCKPPPDSKDPVADSIGMPPGVLESVRVVPYNDVEALREVLEREGSNVAAFILEPVLENVGIIMPHPGYLTAVRELCDKHGVLLIFDEVKTGLTASYNGAAGLYKVTPDLTILAKSIGGGLPVGAFGGREDVMRSLERGAVHHGTYNANPLVLAATKATLDLCSKEVLDDVFERNSVFSSEVRDILADINGAVPVAVTKIGCKGSLTFTDSHPERYEDWKNSDLEMAELSWLWSTNRGVLTPPGLDEQWLVSLAHDKEALSVYLDQLSGLVEALNS